ncbi:hypothetical protein C2G38_2220980 [Gigaspora rosea]|uniref:Uncharacterized protein n=1 Tax=Gigaspora rosea TaxID=44941 RepID=A0A397U3W9_9GLOM|nr:hypothetical protein C2G38_2220979 [Gigaspora rosea]RIB04961.1 hypothetical protein C2G38_2220980 [Gigaspora rosea]
MAKCDETSETMAKLEIVKTNESERCKGKAKIKSNIGDLYICYTIITNRESPISNIILFLIEANIVSIYYFSKYLR